MVHTEMDPAQYADDAAMWDARYASAERIWSGEPNVVLVREVAQLSPGRALDLGCGEGADSVWLARQGWRVTGVDISEVALERAAGHARDAGVADRVEWRRHDLAESFPEGEYDLVSAQFLHTPGTLPREQVLRRAAAAVAPGGVLLVEGHSSPSPWQQDHHHADLQLPSPQQVVTDLRLPEGEWEVLVCEDHDRVQKGPDGEEVHRRDNTVKVRRLPR
ncbi:SAM-dependent methyltransferase [Streptomyces sp. NPDC059740]|uniref:SAM-dependent methyltransferase n=1 Tax=Streptomyces sp. NPDC059740 TaxID=3346926 RepID=UPI0036689777